MMKQILVPLSSWDCLNEQSLCEDLLEQFSEELSVFHDVFRFVAGGVRATRRDFKLRTAIA